MAVTSTPQRLREAASQLLSQRPADKVSLRDITDAAGANVASVGYHFGSKDALLAEVVKAAIEATTIDQQQALQDLPADAPLEMIVRTWLAPALSAETSTSVHQSWRLLRHQLADTTPAVREVIGNAFDQVSALLLVRLHSHLPHLDEQELKVRHLAVLAVLGGLTTLLPAAAAEAGQPQPGGPLGQMSDQIVAFLIGGLTAPSAKAGTAGRYC